MSIRVLSNTNFRKQSAVCSWEWADVAGQHVWCLSVVPTSFIWRRNIKETSAFLTCNTELNTSDCHSVDALLECCEEQVLGLSSIRAPESDLAWLVLHETNHRLTQLISFLWKLSCFSQCELARNSSANIIHTSGGFQRCLPASMFHSNSHLSTTQLFQLQNNWKKS